jgi:hypothetical protein
MLLALAASVALAAPAHATIIFSDGFEGETATTSELNYNSFQNWDVTDGTVDLIREPNNFVIACSEGSFCVDLNGSTGDPGIFSTKQTFTFNANDLITVKFDVSGSQRSGLDGVVVALLPDDPSGTVLANYFELTFNDGFFEGKLGPAALDAGVGYKLAFAGNDPDPDNIGLVIDNVSLDVSAVPEPASWAMMIAGFGLVGGALRTRRRETLATA